MPTRKRIVCGCSFVMAIIDVEDGKPFSMEDYAGLCQICDSNGGDYTLSPHWPYDKVGRPKNKPAKEQEVNRDDYAKRSQHKPRRPLATNQR